MRDYKQQTIKGYAAIAGQVSEGYDEYFLACVKPHADKFLSNFTKSDKLLDLGCGAGTHLNYFYENGYSALGVDVSPEMIQICKNKGLPVQIMDIESLNFPAQSFAGVWAHTSLIHLPKKNLPAALLNIKQILSQQGYLFVAVREGTDEGFEVYRDQPGTERWFSNYAWGELDSYFHDFQILLAERTEFKGRGFLNYHLRLLA